MNLKRKAPKDVTPYGADSQTNTLLWYPVTRAIPGSSGNRKQGVLRFFLRRSDGVAGLLFTKKVVFSPLSLKGSLGVFQEKKWKELHSIELCDTTHWLCLHFRIPMLKVGRTKLEINSWTGKSLRWHEVFHHHLTGQWFPDFWILQTSKF